MASEINETAYQKVVNDMAKYRPDLPVEVIRKIIEDMLSGGDDPMSETAQDVWWGYEKALRKVSHV